MGGQSTLFDVIDYLIAMFTTATAGLAVVYDGFPGPNQEPVIVSVGGTTEPTADGSQDWATMPATAPKSRDEDYLVHCYVSSLVGGGESVDQKAARDAAKAAFQAIESAMFADMRLGTLVLSAQITARQLDQTTDQDAAGGRRADIRFAVRCRARI